MKVPHDLDSKPYANPLATLKSKIDWDLQCAMNDLKYAFNQLQQSEVAVRSADNAVHETSSRITGQILNAATYKGYLHHLIALKAFLQQAIKIADETRQAHSASMDRCISLLRRQAILDEHHRQSADQYYQELRRIQDSERDKDWLVRRWYLFNNDAGTTGQSKEIL